MRFIIKILLSGLLIAFLSYKMPGVFVASLADALVVALVLSFLNAIVKPVLVVLTLPVTIFTLGLFLLVINALLVMACETLVKGFHVDGFKTAFYFSLVLSVGQYVMELLLKKRKD
jgi:putative membrane protein